MLGGLFLKKKIKIDIMKVQHFLFHRIPSIDCHFSLIFIFLFIFVFEKIYLIDLK